MKLLLHIGMPKCGSSALQSYLSSNAFTSLASSRHLYVAVHQDGKLWYGESLRDKAANSVYGYCTSHMGETLSALDAGKRRDLVAQLSELGQQYDTLILSNEGWGPNPEHFTDDCLFANEAFDVSVVAYLRPQVEWMNSAWWQWGAWTGAPLPRWVNANRPKAAWHTLTRTWADKPWVNRVDLRLLNGDIVQDFMGYLGESIPEQVRANQGLPNSVLRLFQRHRALRPGPHDSAIEFVLSRHLQLTSGKSPWVLREPVIDALLKYYQQDNEKLLEQLPPEQQSKMQNDPRWWRLDAYADKPFSAPMAKGIQPAELDSLAVSALEAINRLDAEVRQLRNELRKCQADIKQEE